MEPENTTPEVTPEMETAETTAPMQEGTEAEETAATEETAPEAAPAPEATPEM